MRSVMASTISGLWIEHACGACAQVIVRPKALEDVTATLPRICRPHGLVVEKLALHKYLPT